MADQHTTALKAKPREPAGSRSARRLRREGEVPGVIYGGGEDPVAFAVNARELRRALAHSGAVLDLQMEGGTSTPVVLKELTTHPSTARRFTSTSCASGWTRRSRPRC